MRVRKHMFSKWTQVCEYYPFSDKDKMKELADKDMILRARIKP
jgi:hypothetical protein